MTSLIEISVRNPSAQMAADIANEIAEAYREDRTNQWKGTRGGGIAALTQSWRPTRSSSTRPETN